MKANDKANGSESVLLSSAAQGDLEAFNQLVLAYQDQLFNTARWLVGDETLAADLTQDAFISAFRKISSFRGGSFRGWLGRIIVNLCYDELRRQRRHRVLPLEVESRAGEELDSAFWLADPAATPEKAAEDRELTCAIQDGLNALPTGYRAVLILADIHELKYSEIAEILRVPIGTVKSRLARARLRLREHLQGSGQLRMASYGRVRTSPEAIQSERDGSFPPAILRIT